MLNSSTQTDSLQTRRERHVYSMKVCVALIVFFAVAACLLQWSLASGPQYVADGTPRQFALLETAASLAAATSALLRLAASGLVWSATVLQMRREAAGKNCPRSGRAARAVVTIG
jgi:hypothetical protein